MNSHIEFGVPSDTVLRNLADFERDDQLARAKRTLDADPVVTQWVSDPRNAAVTSDDMDQLAKTSAFWREVGKKAGSITATPAPEPTFWNSLKGWGQTLLSGFQGIGPNIRGVVGDYLPDMTPSSAPGAPALGRDFGNENDRRNRARLNARSDASTPAFKSNLGRWYYGGVASNLQTLPTQLFGIAIGAGSGVGAGTAAALTGMGAQSGISGYNTVRDRGGSRGEAALSGALQGGIEVGTEMLPMSESIARKLMDAGYTPDAARTQAELVTARAATRAARLGEELTGGEYDHLDVARVLPEALAPLMR